MDIFVYLEGNLAIKIYEVYLFFDPLYIFVICISLAIDFALEFNHEINSNKALNILFFI